MAYRADQLKQVHKQVMKDYFYQQKMCNKKMLSEDTGISKTTCTTLLKELMEEKFIIQIENGASTGGRPGKQYQLNKDFEHHCLISLKNGTTMKMEIQIRNLYSEIIFHEENEILQTIEICLYEVLDKAFGRDDRIRSIAVSIPGVTDGRGQILSSDIPELEKWDLATALSQRYSVRVILENDVNLAAVGYDREEQSLVFLYQPQLKYTGCGIMLNHQLYRGSTLFAGEVGYLAGCNRTEPENPEVAGQLLLDQMTALICILNPEVIVVHSFFSYQKEKLIERLEERIPCQHLPQIRIVDEIERYLFEGLMEASVDRQRNPLKVEEVRKL